MLLELRATVRNEAPQLDVPHGHVALHARLHHVHVMHVVRVHLGLLGTGAQPRGQRQRRV